MGRLLRISVPVGGQSAQLATRCNCGKNLLFDLPENLHKPFMSNDIPARQRTRNQTQRPLRPEEEWSGIRELPRHEAREIEIDRNLEIAGTLIGPEGGLASSHTVRVHSAMDRLKNIAPKDAVESMLATFMLQTQALATKAAHSAALDNEFPAVAGAHADRYLRLSLVFLKQAEALAKHRQKFFGESNSPTDAAHDDGTV